MMGFVRLYEELDRTRRSSEKVRLLADYFRTADPVEGAWVLWLMLGNRPARSVTRADLRRAACRAAGVAEWLLDECHAAVGDLSETIALLLPEGPRVDPPALDQLLRVELPRLGMLRGDALDEALRTLWERMDRASRFLMHKIVGGAFRVGVSRGLVVRSLAEVTGVAVPVIEARLAGHWTPDAANFGHLLRGQSGQPDPTMPYPFYLAHPLESAVSELTAVDGVAERHDESATGSARADRSAELIAARLGAPDPWLTEWKWDGIRAQVIVRRVPGARAPVVALWSRGDERLNDAFPELLLHAADLPPGTVLDGEIVAWAEGTPAAIGGAISSAWWPGEGRPRGFAALQRRLNRTGRVPALFEEIPCVFLAFDLLEADGVDIRATPLRERRLMLQRLMQRFDGSGRVGVFRLSPRLDGADWRTAATARAAARMLGVEGLVLKHADSVYGVGRTLAPRTPSAGERSDHPAERIGWYKWKVNPFTVDCVLIAAQRGSGRRASLYTDYTFGLWSGPAPGQGTLLPVAKAYSGLTDEEIDRVDRFIRAHPEGNQAPASSAYRRVQPRLVFELAFERVTRSPRHASGLAVRFPRIARWRTDKPPEQADTLDTIRALLPPEERGPASELPRRARRKR
jgi:DNA ligase-1